MTNKLKFFVAGVATIAFALVAVKVDAAYVHAGLLKQGSRGTQVLALQQALNATAYKVATTGVGSAGYETTTFGPATKAAVIKFQAANGLVADGIVGAATGAKLAGLGGTTVPSGLPAGCTSTSGFSPITGVACNSGANTNTGNTGSLKGGAGNLEITSTTKDVKSNVAEGTSEYVLGVKAKAEDSDIAVTNLKVELSETSTSNGTYRVAKYFDEVSIWLDGKKVGSVDADDFNRDGRKFTKSISLSNAVIASGKEANLYVMVEALSTVDNTAKTFTVKLSDVRYTDATGAILTDSAGQNTSFGFKPEGADDKLTIKRVKSTADTLKVDADDESEEFTVLTFDLETGKKSGDVTVNEIFLDVQLGSAVTNAADVISYIEANGVEGDLITSTTTTARYSFDFDDDFIVDGDDSEEVEIVVAFSAQSGNYGDNLKVSFKVTGSQILAEGATDVTGSGTASSKEQTLSVSSATVDGYKWETAKTDNTAVIDFFFTVDADDEDYNVLSAGVSATATGGVTGTLSLITGDASTTTGGWTVESGDVATFRVRYNFNTSGAKEVKMASVAGKEVPQDKQLSPTVVLQ